ncbi:MAG: sigma-54 dependent transcriptional regulator [Proteobacteria bacterium]|nr:sigma-54 dependent transcriptional regulator [Pseudomonadota bacterium]
MANILIIDDSMEMCKLITGLIKKLGHQATCAHLLEDGMNLVLSDQFDVVMLDVQLPDGSGLDILPRIKASKSSPEVIIMTGYSDFNGAEAAIKNGAWDYIQKTHSTQEIVLALKRVIQYKDGQKQIKHKPLSLKVDNIRGSSKQIKACFDQLAHAAANDINVLVTGETGTGKELFARAIHENSNRANNNFVVVDCGALPETLVTSILFGYEKGAYTGAEHARDGLVKHADGGTLFLDEIGELPEQVQRVLLRVLQEKSYRPIGGKKEIKSDFRLVAATNRDLEKMADAGEFRNDLIYRLKAFEIKLPPLRERVRDITEIALYYMNQFSTKTNQGTKGFSPEFLEALHMYTWPGNVRELINAIEKAISIARDEAILFPVHLPDNIRTQVTYASIRDKKGERGLNQPDIQPHLPETLPCLKIFMDITEKKYLEQLVCQAAGSIQEMLDISGLSRSRLYERLKKYDLKVKG